MASILRNNEKWRAQVRRRGFPVMTKTFDTEELARAWAAQQEERIGMLRHDVHIDPAKGASKYRVAGVYMLLRGREVRYIGRSSHIYRRLNDHNRKEVEWDRFRIFPCSNSIEAADLESKMIKRYQPPLNVALTSTSDPKRKGKNKNIFSRYGPPPNLEDEEWEEIIAAKRTAS